MTATDPAATADLQERAHRHLLMHFTRNGAFGPGGKPLLVLDQVGKGRVAALLSDQTWLWSRGFEGGGPDAELLRRLAHWLMKQPELEAESLSATVVNGEIHIARRTMADAARPVTVTTPSGKTMTSDLAKSAPGLWNGRVPATELGLYRLSDGALSTVVAAGPLNPRERPLLYAAPRCVVCRHGRSRCRGYLPCFVR